jgi:peptide methionine sulfoxide reductase msrA/msrB
MTACLLLTTADTSAVENSKMKTEDYNKLTPDEERVIINKGTEAPFSGKYNNFFEDGIYSCKRCNAHLYRSDDKFHSGCGWPSFDDEIPGAVKRIPDPDGKRTEIICAECGAHLGHVFKDEHLTDKNLRHCVNSISLKFTPAPAPKKQSQTTAKAWFAGGCFWGVEYLFEHKKGVTNAVSGYMGGSTDNPSYDDVCRKNTGHYETVEVTYDPGIISFEDLAKFFLEIHDPTQKNGQGPDIGPQYQSVIFVSNATERRNAEKLLNILRAENYDVSTRILPASTFWKAEDYHQNYYDKNHKQPYCHKYTERF